MVRGLFLFWAADSARLTLETPRPWLPTLQGVLAALFASALVGLPAAGALAALAWLSVDDDAPPRPPLGARMSGWLRGADDATRIGRAAALLAVPPALGVFVAAAFLGGRHVVVGMARPELAAWALVGVALGALVVALVAYVGPLHGAVRRALAALDARVRVTPARALASLGVIGALVASAFVYVYRRPLAYVHWDLVLSVLGATLASALWPWLVRRGPAALRPALAGLTWLLGCLSLVSLYPWPGELYARRVAEQRSRIGLVSYGALKLAFDADRDGYLPLVSGGDCAPFDAAIHPGAVDVPGDGRDQDCDGVDLDPGVLPALGTIDHPVRSDVPYRPPIVLVTIDVLAAARLASFGAARSAMPNLDDYAARSALFERCFVQGPSTRLSFPAMFTARWDSQIVEDVSGHHPYPLDPSEHTLAEILREHGYDTVAVLPDPYFSPNHWRGITQGFQRVIESPFAPPAPPHTGAKVTDAALAELARPRSHPLFMWVHYFDAHGPHDQPVDVPLLGRGEEASYQAELGLVDRELARLLDGLAARLPNALVIITGDHGTAFDEPRHSRLGYGYDLSSAVLHVPLIVHAPFVAPHRVPGPSSSLDILPTLVNLLRIRGDFGFSGVSLVPELLDARASRPPLVMSQFFLAERQWSRDDPLVLASLRTERFNLIHDRTSDFYELYDYRSDYFERHDLSVEPAYQDTLAKLRRQLLVMTWLAERRTGEAEPAPRPAPGLWQRLFSWWRALRERPAQRNQPQAGALDAGTLLAPAHGLDAGIPRDAGSHS